jgi:hypothetical protein
MCIRCRYYVPGRCGVNRSELPASRFPIPRCPPSTVHRPPFTVDRSPSPISHLPSPHPPSPIPRCYRSPFTNTKGGNPLNHPITESLNHSAPISHLPSPGPPSPFTVHCSLFTVHCSLFTVHRSPFTGLLNHQASTPSTAATTSPSPGGFPMLPRLTARGQP